MHASTVPSMTGVTPWARYSSEQGGIVQVAPGAGLWTAPGWAGNTHSEHYAHGTLKGPEQLVIDKQSQNTIRQLVNILYHYRETPE